MESVQDKNKINIHEDWELQHWAGLLGVSKEQLVAAVRNAGPDVSIVINHLHTHGAVRGAVFDSALGRSRRPDFEDHAGYARATVEEELEENGSDDPIVRADIYLEHGFIRAAKGEIHNAYLADPGNPVLYNKLSEIKTLEAARRKANMDRFIASVRAPGARASQGDTHTEQLATTDVLQREKITDALVQLLTLRTDTAPFALGLFGHWGSGKSSQIRFVKQQLASKSAPRLRIVDFNAWEHEHCENMGAALAQSVVDHFVDGLGFWGRVKLAGRLVQLRNHGVTAAIAKDGSSLRNQLTSFLHIGTPLVVPVSVMSFAAYLFLHEGWSPLGGFASAIATLSALWLTAKTYVSSNLTDWFKGLNTEKIQGAFKLPDFSAKLGSFHEVHTTLKQLCALCLPGETVPVQGEYLLLVVDDLDRCSPQVVKQVFDAVRLVANIPRVVTMVALDERIAFAAVEKHFAQFNSSGREPQQVARDYLAKVFQVAVSLPQASPEAADSYIRNKLFANLMPPAADALPDANMAAPPQPAQPSGHGVNPVNEAAPLTDSWHAVLPPEVEAFASLAKDTGIINPRALWRLKQAWFLLRGLALRDGDGITVMRPWLRSLFCREWLLQSRAELRGHVESALHKGTPLDATLNIPAAMQNLLEEERGSWSGNWPVVDIFLLPAGTGAGKPSVSAG